MAIVTGGQLGALSGARILITGDTGFKGGWTAEWLMALGADVIGFALPPEGPDPLFNRLRLVERIDHRDGDLRDFDAVQTAIAETRPDAVIHMAAQSLVLTGYAEPKTTFDTNVAGSVNLLEALRATTGVRALIYVTSDKVYRDGGAMDGCEESDPLGGEDPYSASKAAAEMVFEAYDRSYFARRDDFGAVSVRAGNVIGGGDWAENRIVPDCIRALRDGSPITLRNPTAIRPWQHVLEPLSGYLRLAAVLLENPASVSGAWNFGPERDDMRPVRDLAERVRDCWGGGEIIERPDPDAPPEAPLLFLDSTKARNGLGWRPQWDFDAMNAETVAWYKQVIECADPVAVTGTQIESYMENEND